MIFLRKLTTFIMMGFIGLMPIYATAAQQFNSTTKTSTALPKAITAKSVKKAIQGKKQTAIRKKKVKKHLHEANLVRKQKKTKIASSNRARQSHIKRSHQSAHSKKIAKNSAKNETKKLYGVKGIKLTHVKVSNKIYRYREKGKTYTSISKEHSRLFSQTGIASYYGGKFHGRKTANGEFFNKHAYTAAHKTLALGSYALVTNLRNGRKVIVKINDRGPFSKNRVIDLSVAAAKEIGMFHLGMARVKIEAMHVDRHGYISGSAAHSLYRLAKREGLPLKVKGQGKHFAIKAE